MSQLHEKNQSDTDIRAPYIYGGRVDHLQRPVRFSLGNWSTIQGFERHLNRGINKVDAAKERERLFQIIEDLVVWENTNDASVISAARTEIWKSWRETCELNRNHPDAATLFNSDVLPAFHDPFAGGGAIPLEAQRLGLEAYASDLNPRLHNDQQSNDRSSSALSGSSSRRTTAFVRT